MIYVHLSSLSCVLLPQERMTQLVRTALSMSKVWIDNCFCFVLLALVSYEQHLDKLSKRFCMLTCMLIRCLG